VIRIALIGPMGVGKTTVGRALSDRLQGDFIDLDEQIENRANQSIESIFQHRGEEAFRKLELEALSAVTLDRPTTPVVVSTGGGIVVTPEARDELHRHFTVIWLNASVETLVRRLESDLVIRPLLHTGEALEMRVRELVRARTPLYHSVADCEIRTDDRTPNEIVEDILHRLSSGKEA
jgi:shikimate kinase